MAMTTTVATKKQQFSIELLISSSFQLHLNKLRRRLSRWWMRPRVLSRSLLWSQLLLKLRHKQNARVFEANELWIGFAFSVCSHLRARTVTANDERSGKIQCETRSWQKRPNDKEWNGKGEQRMKKSKINDDNDDNCTSDKSHKAFLIAHNKWINRGKDIQKYGWKFKINKFPERRNRKKNLQNAQLLFCSAQKSCR